ncbi:YbaN family protein [Aureimonas sp. ME7]|uniref:YbaN family protein n=1 Tax=Aureimonas sp. ME7 TaxID=2744252 RepID=UPI0015F5D134|nr:YbaN family protein [Aureimonas sp. ME7]
MFRALAMAALGLAILGVALPGLPTTLFLLLAAWAAARSSPELAARIDNHPRFGPPLRAWRERDVVPLRAKIFALGSMAASLAILGWSGAPAIALAGVGAVMVAVAAFLLTRPSD